MDRMEQDELKNHDGVEGNKSYVAFEGRIYDVTSSRLWRNGKHFKTHQAGRDLTESMKAAPHGAGVLEKFSVVAEIGLREKSTVMQTAMKTPSRLVSKILDQHPHPISVHFPIALCVSASLFTFLGMVTPLPHMIEASYYNLIIAALGTPVSISTGLLSWYYNYSGIWTHIYRVKTYLSILLAILLLAAFVILFVAMDGVLSGSGPWYWAYSMAVLALAPTVVGLGYFGGKITFPS
jgi:predicted heme/steroid binding protein/uncharacterized membrane protein